MKRLYTYILISFVWCIASFGQKHTPDHYDYAIRQAFAENRWEAGKYMIDEAEPYYGTLSNFYELKGWYYYHNKDYVQSRYMLSKCLQDDDFNTHAKTLISKVEEDTKHYSSAICYINELLENNAYDRTLWLRKINMYRKLGNNVEADKLIKRLAEIYPNDTIVRNIFDDRYNEAYREGKKGNDISSQLSYAKDLVRVNPTADNYIQYVNALISAGYLNEALDVAGIGIKKTNSYQLIKKRCDILCEQGKYNEALNFIANHPSARGLKSLIEKEQTYMSVQYDAYLMYQKMFAQSHNKESFNFIVNTALSRGYYYDAIDFIQEYKKHTKSVTADVLYKEYTAYKRLGNNDKSVAILEQINRLSPNSGIEDETCEAYYKQATSLISEQEYKQATEKLEYVIKESSDTLLIQSATKRLYTCYMEMKDYDKALQIADDDNKRIGILVIQGKYEQALSLVGNDSITYSEIIVPYIKNLVQERKYQTALSQCDEALKYVHDKEIYQYAIGCCDRLEIDNRKYINEGILNYPTDEYFIQQFCGIMNFDALAMIKNKDYDGALSIVNKGLEYDKDNKELIMTRGIIYEKQKKYDLAYESQKIYSPSAIEQFSFVKKMQGMQQKQYKNGISAYYEYYRTESQDVLKSQAGFDYYRKLRKGSIDAILNYTSRDDARDMYDLGQLEIGGGQALLGGATYTHPINDKYEMSYTALFGYKYYPSVTLGVQMSKVLKKDWTINCGMNYKNIKSYGERFNIIDLYGGCSKSISDVILSGKCDLFYINNIYFNISGKCDYFPIEGNHTKLFVGCGVGSAPEMTMSRTIIPKSFKNMNVSVNGGFVYFLNQHVGIGLQGNWYSVYNNEENVVKYINLFYIHTNAIIRF